MRLFKKRDDIQSFIALQQQKGLQIAFVPTMGALHQGHINLIKNARENSDVVICSIFVNPTQFNDKKDLEKYPRTLEKDVRLLLQNHCDAIFCPDVDEVYPAGTTDSLHFELGPIEKILEGKFRPGHFQGVCDILYRLFNIIKPDIVFFGQKDLQQCKVVEKLLQQVAAFQQIQMHIVPTLRESSMLAMSSRNKRLSSEGLRKAPVIYQTLLFLKNNLKQGDTTKLKNEAIKKLEAAGCMPDYVAIARETDLQEIQVWDGREPVYGLIAAFLEEVRLIDNLKLG